jgi:PAS domain S-box-containing protein
MIQTMKSPLSSLSQLQLTLALLFTFLLLPIAIKHSYFWFSFNKLELDLIYFELATAFVASLLLSYPVYRLVSKINQRETQTSETRRNVEELIDQAADMIFITRPNGQIVYANRRACSTLGYRLDELQRMRNMDLDTECVLYRTPKLHQQLYQGDTITFETLYRSAKGEKIPVEAHVSIAGWMENTHYMEIVRDISRRRAIEQELYASKEALERARNRLETRMQERTEKLVKEVQKRELTEKRIFEIRLLLENLVNSMPSVIIALDGHLNITQWNLEAEKVFGIFEAAAVGKPITQLLPQFRATIFRLMRRSANGKKAHQQTISIVINDQKRQFDVMVYPLSQTVTHQPPGVVIRLDDITEKARFDEMLVQTEKMLSLGGLAAGMAHEINNPLGAILQSIQNVQRRLSPEFPRNQHVAAALDLDLSKVVEYLQQQRVDQALAAIKEAGERAATIVADMLSFARPNRGEMESINVIDALKASIRLAAKDYNQKRQLDFRNIQIKEHYADGLPSISAQKNQLNQVVLNLLINAAQALALTADKRKPVIEISARQVGAFIRIDIRDNGPGMDEATRKRVFEPFFTTKEEGKGTGLGLSVSYFIITEQMKGQMMVESELGVGSCFTLLLPVQGYSSPLDQGSITQPVQLPLNNLE